METNPASGFRIDERVFSAMALIAFVLLLVLALSFKFRESAEEVRITRSASSYNEGSAINFKAETSKGTKFEWDFGDNSEPDFSANAVSHIYKAAGKYLVKVRVNNNSEGVDTLEIGKVQMEISTALEPIILIPDSAVINKPVTFRDITPDAITWKWRFFDDGIVTEDTSRNAYYTYKTDGIKKVFLMINGRPDRIAMTSIYVKPSPFKKQDIPEPVIKQAPPIIFPKIPVKPTGDPLVPPVTPPTKDDGPKKPVMAPDIQADGMIELLEGVVAGKKEAADFTKYFCDQADIQVTYNEVPMKFSQMFKKLKEVKKTKNISKPEVQLIKDNSTNCVQSMNVTVKKRSLFEKITGKNN